jgi:hypothetical protein
VCVSTPSRRPDSVTTGHATLLSPLSDRGQPGSRARGDLQGSGLPSATRSFSDYRGSAPSAVRTITSGASTAEIPDGLTLAA